MPAAAGKYLVVEASTLEIRKRQRLYLENLLKSTDLTPNRRAQIEASLRLASDKENEAKDALEQLNPADTSVKKKKDEEEGEGKKSVSGGAGGAQRVAEDGDEAENDEEEMSGFDLMMLFLYMMGQNSLPVNAASVDPMSVAQLLLNKEQKVAELADPYDKPQGNVPHPQAEYLSAIEQYAAGLGMLAMYVKVHPEIANIFKEKFGYEPHGEVINRKGNLVQRMRKILAPVQASTATPSLDNIAG